MSELPVITTQPLSQTVHAGTSVALNVIASGTNLSYQWQTYSFTSNSWRDIDGVSDATTPTFHIGFMGLWPSPSSDNKYRCKVSNDAGTVYSDEAIITVVYMAHPESITVRENDTATFSVEVYDKTEAKSYQWRVNVDTNPNTPWVEISGATSASYSFPASMASNGYQYDCQIVRKSDNYKISSNVATLTVTPDDRVAPPAITSSPQSATIQSGEQYPLLCAATGENLSYQWQINKTGNWVNISGATSANYILTGAVSQSGAKYRCQVSNLAGSAYSSAATIIVIGGGSVSTPVIRSNPRSISVPNGGTATFSIAAAGGSLSYRWQVKRNNTWYDVTGATSPVYSFTASNSDNGTEYRCVVSNSAGSATSTSAILTIRESGPLPMYGYHSIIISGKNTYGEWEMYPTSRPHVAPPEVKTSYVDVPGADGGLDYTELLNGHANYGYRKGSWEFLLIPQEKWPKVYRSLVSYLHGREHTIVLEDDPNIMYTGRLSVNQWQSAAHNSLITIDYILDPEAVDTSGGGYDPYEQDFDAAARILRRPEYTDYALILSNGSAIAVPISSLYEVGDNITY